MRLRADTFATIRVKVCDHLNANIYNRGGLKEVPRKHETIIANIIANTANTYRCAEFSSFDDRVISGIRDSRRNYIR